MSTRQHVIVLLLIVFFPFGMLLPCPVFGQELSLSGSINLGNAYIRAREYLDDLDIGSNSEIAEGAQIWQKRRDEQYPQPYSPDVEIMVPPNISPPAPADAVVELNRALDRQIRVREQRIRELTQTRDGWSKVLLRLIDHDDNWREGLQDWSKKSQRAQIAAITACVKLLLGSLGPVQEAVEVHGYNSASLYKKIQELKPRLDEAKVLLASPSRRGGDAGKVGKAVAELTKLHDQLASLMKGEIRLKELFNSLKKGSERIIVVAGTLEKVSKTEAKEDLLLALKTLQNMVVDILKDAGLDRLEDLLAKAGMEGGGGAIKLANFLIEYGYQSVSFYVAWHNVHLILSEIEDKVDLQLQMSHRIRILTDQCEESKDELKGLREARTSTDGEKKTKLLYELRAVENYKAWLYGGKWFHLGTGVMDPGEPI